MRGWQGWQGFDPISAVITTVALPLLYLSLRIAYRNLKPWLSNLLDAGFYWASRSVQHQIAGSFSVRRYAKLSLGKAAQHLHIPARVDVLLPIDKCYVPLALETGLNSTAINQEQLFQDSSQVIIIGDPGSGKSSLTKWLFRTACRHAIDEPRTARIPVALELKLLEPPDDLGPSEAGKWLLETLRLSVVDAGTFRMSDTFDVYQQESGVLILLDGLDEVSTSRYPKVAQAITELSRLLLMLGTNNRLVVTMRTQFYHQVQWQFRDSLGIPLRLRPFTNSDIYEFLRRWPFASNPQESMTRIYTELAERPSLREICRNPLVLSMYLAEYQSSSTALAPDSRSGFYSKVLDELLLYRRLKQEVGTKPVVAPTKLRDTRQNILGKISYRHLVATDQPINSIPWKDALQDIIEENGCGEAEAAAILREISRDTGLITEEKFEATLRFIHLSFAEFLAAGYVINSDVTGWMNLLQVRAELSAFGSNSPERVREIIAFAAGLSPTHQRQEILNAVEQLGDDYLLQVCFLETKLYEHAAWSRFAVRQQESLLSTPESEWNEGWLRKLQFYSMVVRDARNCSEHSPLIAETTRLDSFFGRLAELQKASMHKILEAYAAEDASAALQLAEAYGLSLARDFPEVAARHCDQRPFFDAATQRLYRNDQQEWVFVLASAGLAQPVVGYRLYRLEGSGHLQAEIDSIPRSKRWNLGMIMGELTSFVRLRGSKQLDLFSQCLTIAINRDSSKTALLSALAELPAPGFQLRRAAAIGATALSFVTFFVTFIFDPGLNSLEYFAGMTLSNFILYGIMINYLAHKRIYRAVIFKQRPGRSVLNIWPWPYKLKAVAERRGGYSGLNLTYF